MTQQRSDLRIVAPNSSKKTLCRFISFFRGIEIRRLHQLRCPVRLEFALASTGDYTNYQVAGWGYSLHPMDSSETKILNEHISDTRNQGRPSHVGDLFFCNRSRWSRLISHRLLSALLCVNEGNHPEANTRYSLPYMWRCARTAL
jgi:hypothetical protein